MFVAMHPPCLQTFASWRLVILRETLEKAKSEHKGKQKQKTHKEQKRAREWGCSLECRVF